MDKLKKVGLTALGTALVSSGAMAADMAVTGGATLTLSQGEKVNSGNGWSHLSSLAFRASADMDNGWTVSTAQNLGKGAVNNANMIVNMGDLGTLEFHTVGGSSAAGAWDDMLPAANEETWHGLTGAAPGGAGPLTDTGFGADSFKYSVSAMDGLTLYASYMPSDGATALESSSAIGVKYTGVEGLEVGYAQGENNKKVAVTTGNGDATNTGATSIENQVAYAKYAFDSFTIGIQANESDSDTASADTEYSGIGVSYAVTEDLSVSYAMSEMDFQASADLDQETSALGFSYTQGSMTLSGSHHRGENLGGTASNDRNGYELNLAFAF